MVFRLLLRDWRGGQLPLILMATILAVTIISAVTLVAERIEKVLLQETTRFLAADLALDSGVGIPAETIFEARERGLQTALTAYFPSMVYSGDSNYLAAIKVVSSAYPLRGELTVSSEAFAADDSQSRIVQQAPPPGEAWVDERLLPLLDAELGDVIELGRTSLKMTQVLISEPDRGTGFSLIGARLMMNMADLREADLIKPGSQVSWRLLLAGENDQVTAFGSDIRERKNPHIVVVEPVDVEERIGAELDRGRTFLVLASIIGLLLSGIVLALTSRRYADQQIDRVALMKCWGVSAARVRLLYLGQIVVIGIVAAVIGTIVGWFTHLAILELVGDLLPNQLPQVGLEPLLLAAVTAPVCLAGFAIPALYHLPGVAPMRVLRRDLPTGRLDANARLGWGILTVYLLLLFYSGQLLMPTYFMLGLMLVVLLISTLGFLLFRSARQFSRWSGSEWRLAAGNLLRHRGQTLLQMIAFSTGIMLLLVLVIVRTSLVDEWRMQIPADAPNHFLVNVTPDERIAISRRFETRELTQQPWFPMLRARLIRINDEALSRETVQRVSGIRREVNLSWSEGLPAGNKLVAGSWWSLSGSEQGELPQVSVEQEIAEELQLELGDLLTFSIGGVQIEARISSFRELDWNSMNPNFFFLFSPGVLEDYESTWITSVFIPGEERKIVSEILKNYPTVMVVSLQEALNNIRQIIEQASSGLEMIFLLVIFCGILVFIAATAASFDERARELALLRTLGGSRRFLLSATAAEFLILGTVSGIVAAVGAESSIMLLQHFSFGLQAQTHPELWLAGPLGGAAFVTLLGLWRTFRLVNTPPLLILKNYT